MIEKTGNMTRDMFNYIRDHGPFNTYQITEAMVKLDYKESSVTSLLTQMRRGGLLRKNDGFFYATASEYRSVYASKKQQEQARIARLAAKAQAKVQAKNAAGIAALTEVTPAQIAHANAIKSQWDAQTILDNLPIRHARALYDELHKIFGGK